MRFVVRLRIMPGQIYTVGRLKFHKSGGLSLLEIMITMILLTTVLITFAAVYPAGYKLNRKTALAAQAAKAANTVAEEVQSLPFDAIGTVTQVTLGDLEDTPWTPATAASYKAKNFDPARHVKQPFFLDSINVDVHQVNGFDVAATISVTVGYRDLGRQSFSQSAPTDPALEIRHVTITTAKTSNR